jgi:hypothetical protein
MLETLANGLTQAFLYLSPIFALAIATEETKRAEKRMRTPRYVESSPKYM